MYERRDIGNGLRTTSTRPQKGSWGARRALLLVVAPGLSLPSCATHHEEGEGPLRVLAAEQIVQVVQGRHAGFEGTFGAIPLCVDGPGSVTLISVRPGTISDGATALGWYARVNDWNAGEMPIGTADGWPPDLGDLEEVEGFAVTQRCSDTDASTVTELGFGLKKTDNRGGMIQDLDIEYTYEGADYILRTHVGAVICGDDATDTCQ